MEISPLQSLLIFFLTRALRPPFEVLPTGFEAGDNPVGFFLGKVDAKAFKSPSPFWARDGKYSGRTHYTSSHQSCEGPGADLIGNFWIEGLDSAGLFIDDPRTRSIVSGKVNLIVHAGTPSKF